tara:strand:- start:630 stop:1718 length:1089 start_codon:yes stop_codon:yes gene_type:complete
MASVITSDIGEMKNIPLPSAGTSMIFFLCITIIYGFLVIYATISSSTLSNVISNADNPVFTIIYIALLIIGTYFINISISKKICMGNTIQWSSVLFVTILPWLIIFGLLYLLLELFPSWINPFSNTIGFFVVNTLGATQAVKAILKSSTIGEDTTLKKALENIENNYSRFINEIDTDKDNYSKFIKQLYSENFIMGNASDSGKFETFLNDPKSVKLFALINIKTIVGKLFWYVLAGTLISSISYNFIINMSCEKSLDQTKQEYADLYENSRNPVYGKKWQSLQEEPSESDNQDYTTQLSVFIDKFKYTFISAYKSGTGEVELTGHQMRELGLSYDELPHNSYIQMSYMKDDIPEQLYFRPIE